MKTTLNHQDGEISGSYANFQGYTSGLGIVKSNPERKATHSGFGIIKQRDVPDEKTQLAFAEN